jgi:hypothetical protein
MEAFVLQAAKQAILQRSQAFEPFDEADSYASGLSLAGGFAGRPF